MIFLRVKEINYFSVMSSKNVYLLYNNDKVIGVFSSKKNADDSSKQYGGSVVKQHELNTIFDNVNKPAGGIALGTVVPSSSSKTQTNGDATVKNTCCRVKRGKSDPCGTIAKNEYEGKWYCAACYKIASTEKPAAAASKASQIRKVVPVNNMPPVLKKAIGSVVGEPIRTVQQKLPNGTVIHYYAHNKLGNILFDRDTSAAYGMFKDGKISDLTHEAILWCESNNIKMKDDLDSDEESVDSDEESKNGSNNETEDEEEEDEEDDEEDDDEVDDE